MFNIMRAYSQDLRERVISTYNRKEFNIVSIAKMFDIHRMTISRWIKQYKQTGNCHSRQGVECGRKQSFTDKQAIITYLKDHPNANGIEIRDAVAPKLHMNTFYDTLSRMKITYKKRANIQRKVKS